MRQLVIILIAVSVSVSCMAEGHKTDTLSVDSREQETPSSPVAEKAASDNGWERLVMVSFKDDRGRTLVEMPFPPSWKIQQRVEPGMPHITGPHGLRVVDYPFQAFLYSQDPQLQQVYWLNGKSMRPLPDDPEELIRQDFVSWGSEKGLQFVRYYELPEIARIDSWYDEQLFKVSPPKKQIKAFGTEWKKSNGDPFFLLIRLNATEIMGTVTWSYFSSSLEADPPHYELAKKQLIFGIANAHYNPEPILEYNRAEAERVNQSWAAFSKRMAESQAAFQAQQRDFVNRSNAINETVMSGWREQNAASDRSHGKFVDAITERTNTVNPNTGTHQKVESGYNQYWMNSEGKYIGTDNPSYDPNLDEVLNKQQWDKLKEVNR